VNTMLFLSLVRGNFNDFNPLHGVFYLFFLPFPAHALQIVCLSIDDALQLHATTWGCHEGWRVYHFTCTCVTLLRLFCSLFPTVSSRGSKAHSA
jgi:hypothetical protein